MIVGVGRWRQGEKPFGLGDGLAKPGVALVQADEVEQVAMFAGRGVDPVADPPTPGFEQADIETAPRRSGNVAHHPVAPLAAPFGKVMTADGLNILCEPLRQVRCAG